MRAGGNNARKEASARKSREAAGNRGRHPANASLTGVLRRSGDRYPVYPSIHSVTGSPMEVKTALAPIAIPAIAPWSSPSDTACAVP